MPQSVANPAKTTLSLVLLMMMLLHSMVAHGMPSFALPESLGQKGIVSLNPVLEYVSLPLGTPFPEVRSLIDSQWRSVDGVRGFGYSHDKTYWFRVRLKGLKSLPHSANVRLDFPHHDVVHFAVVVDGHLATKMTTGDSKPFGTRPSDHAPYLLPLNRYGVNELDLYVGVASAGSLIVPLDVITDDALVHHEKIELAWFTGYFAVIGIILLNNLFVYSFVRDRTYLYYLGYLLSVGGLIFLLEGSAFRYLWPDLPQLNNLAVMIATPLTPLLAVLFVIRFLNLREVGDTLDYRLARGLAVLFTALVLAAWLAPYHLHLRLTLLCSVVAIAYAFYLGIKYSWRGYRSARLFALAWFVYLVFVVIFILDVSAVLQPTFLTRNALVIGSALELALLSIAFADRFHQEKKQRIAAQRRALEAQQTLNERLDALVRSRTRELQQVNLELERLSLSDPLTGLANRRHLDQQLQIELDRARRTGASLSVGIVDVDYFKQVNDTFGHDAGDRCLVTIADAIQQLVNRPADIVARLGGEEFAFVLTDCGAQGAASVAEKIRRHIAALDIQTDQGVIHVTASIGTASGRPSGQLTAEQLLKRADANLYQAKSAGRNRVETTSVPA